MTRGGDSAFIYLLVEHQSEPDRWMALRLHGYVHRIWEQWLREHDAATHIPAVLPIVVHHGASGWTLAASLSAAGASATGNAAVPGTSRTSRP